MRERVALDPEIATPVARLAAVWKPNSLDLDQEWPDPRDIVDVDVTFTLDVSPEHFCKNTELHDDLQIVW